MSDPTVERWRQAGLISMWKSKNPRWDRWNLTADDAACAGLVELLDRMENAQWPSKKELELIRPGVTADNGGKFRAATCLTLKYAKGRVPEDHWVLEEPERASILLEVGLAYLRELREAIADIRQGGGDYCIGADGNELWVWWYLKPPSKKA
jgi:hypothetical protein